MFKLKVLKRTAVRLFCGLIMSEKEERHELQSYLQEKIQINLKANIENLDGWLFPDYSFLSLKFLFEINILVISMTMRLGNR